MERSYTEDTKDRKQLQKEVELYMSQIESKNFLPDYPSIIEQYHNKLLGSDENLNTLNQNLSTTTMLLFNSNQDISKLQKRLLDQEKQLKYEIEETMQSYQKKIDGLSAVVEEVKSRELKLQGNLRTTEEKLQMSQESLFKTTDLLEKANKERTALQKEINKRDLQVNRLKINHKRDLTDIDFKIRNEEKELIENSHLEIQSLKEIISNSSILEKNLQMQIMELTTRLEKDANVLKEEIDTRVRQLVSLKRKHKQDLKNLETKLNEENAELMKRHEAEIQVNLIVKWALFCWVSKTSISISTQN